MSNNSFSKNIPKGLSKPEEKFIMDMFFGIARGQSVLLTDISRALEESIKLKNTVERLSDHLALFSDEDLDIIKSNYYQEVKKHIDKEPHILLDDSEIVKKYSSSENSHHKQMYICFR